jgi:hypothetical protein
MSVSSLNVVKLTATSASCVSREATGPQNRLDDVAFLD